MRKDVRGILGQEQGDTNEFTDAIIPSKKTPEITVVIAGFLSKSLTIQSHPSTYFATNIIQEDKDAKLS